MGLLPKVCLLSMLLFMQYGCASYGKYPVDAKLQEEPVQTTVDSATAQYYLNHYLQGERLDAKLDRRIDKDYLDVVIFLQCQI